MKRPANLSSRPSLISSGATLRLEHAVAAKWTVSDTGLRPVPPFYPPLNPRCTTFVGDALPSVVAVRITECLRKQSIAVEYDEDNNTATCMTMDRVHFTINLYRGGQASRKSPDFSHGVIIECVRVRGDTISFHYACRAILKASMGQSDGTNVQRHKSPLQVWGESSQPCLGLARSTSAGLKGLEHAVSLLKKDRIDAQRLGMESLVMLTDEQTSGKELALYCSLAVLGAGPAESSEGAHVWVKTLIQDRLMPGEGVETAEINTVSHVVEGDSSTGIVMVGDGTSTTASSTTGPVLEDAHHGGVLRSLALRTFMNALTLLSKMESKLLRSILLSTSPQLVSKEFLSALSQDLLGASRPPAIVVGTRFASPHEAAMATRCLKILSEHSQVATTTLLKQKDGEPILELLDKARHAGRTSHAALAKEGDLAFATLSQDVRTF